MRFLGALSLACGGGESDSSGFNSSPSSASAGDSLDTGATAIDPTTGGSAPADTQGPQTDGGDETTTPAATSETGETVTSKEAATDVSATTLTSTDATTDATTDDASTGGIAEFPAEVLGLSNWKITLPIAGDDPDKPLEIFQPELATYTNDPYFLVSGDGVRFRAHAGGVTTSNCSTRT